MDIVEAHARRLPSIDDRWVPRPYPREALERGLLDGRVAGPVSHPLENVLLHIALMNEGDPDKQFGLEGLPGALSDERVLPLGDDAAVVAYRATATRDDVTYTALFNSTYVREAGEWRLAVHQQTPI